ncbi:MAG: aspartate/glutamate racemase family protein [Pseudomonadota bacterium]
MHIGMIGGIGPAATDFYYQRLITNFAKRGKALELTMVHADSPTLIANLASNDTAAQVTIYKRLADRLAAAGAGCVVVTSIGGHFCIKEFEAVSPLPVINMLTEVERAVTAKGLKRIGIMGTRTVMETKFYGSFSQTEVVPPQGDLLDQVHDAYVTMATAGYVTSEQRQVFDTACEQFLQRDQVEAILLGGTDLALVYDSETSDFPLVDGAAIHVNTITEAATR